MAAAKRLEDSESWFRSLTIVSDRFVAFAVIGRLALEDSQGLNAAF